MAVNKTVNKRTNTHGAMRNCIQYVLQKKKTEGQLVAVTGPYPYEEITYDLVYQKFLEEKRLWDKDSGRMYAHNIISWHKDEQITPEEAFQFGREFTEKWFPGFQTLITVHQDKNHIHCHLVTNSVSYENGRKLHNSRKDLERMKQMTNQMCRERGLSVAEKGKHFDGTPMEQGEVITWSKDKYNLFRNDTKKSYVAECAMAVLSIMEHCKNKEQFINGMKQLGWDVNWTEQRKHITFQNQEGQKVRDSNLSKTFRLQISKGGLEDEFIRNEEKERDRISGAGTAGYELEQYYRQVGAYEGAGSDVPWGDQKAQRLASEELIRQSKAARRAAGYDRGASEYANRIVQNAESQSIAAEEQRRSEEQKRLDEQKRAREARKRNKRCSEPEL